MADSRNCQICRANYINLYSQVSHMRAVHSVENDLNFTCQVDGCPAMFKRPDTWYKHVLNSHRQEYYNSTGISAQAGEDGTYDMSGDLHGEREDSDMGDEREDCILGDDMHDEDNTLCDTVMHEDGTSDLPPMELVHSEQLNNSIPSFISDDVVPGKLLKLKEQYMLSHAALGEVVELVQTVCNNMSTRMLSEILKRGELFGMDLSSDFFEGLPELFVQQSYPLISLETAFKQQSYICKKLPYVVQNHVHHCDTVRIVSFFYCRSLYGLNWEPI